MISIGLVCLMLVSNTLGGIIACNHDFKCTESSYTCVPGEKCYIYCFGDAACKDTIFNCPSDYDCNILGEGVEVFKNTQIYKRK